MNNRNDEMAAWLNEPSSTSDDRTLDLFFEYYVLSEQETLTDQEKVKLSALKKSLFGDGAPTNEELSQYHYLFVNAPAQQQAGQMPTKKTRAKNDTPDYLKDELKRIYDTVVDKKPAGVIAEIERLCRIKSSGWKLDVNTSVAVFSCYCPLCLNGMYSKSITLTCKNISKSCSDFR